MLDFFQFRAEGGMPILSSCVIRLLPRGMKYAAQGMISLAEDALSVHAAP